jgi:transcriptional regulator with XRE-family HTH domain
MNRDVLVEIDMNLASRLRAARETAGLTQPEVAAAIGCSNGAYAAWELGRNRTIKSRYLPALINVLGVRAEWLLSGEGEMKPAMPEELLEAVLGLDDSQMAALIAMAKAFKK